MNSNNTINTNRAVSTTNATHPPFRSDTGQFGSRDVYQDENNSSLIIRSESHSELTLLPTPTDQPIHARAAEGATTSTSNTGIQWHAGNYKLHSKSQSNDAQRLADNLLATYAIKLPVKVICDLGCGTGNNLSPYSDKFQSKVVYAVEPRKNMLDAIPAPASNQVKIKPQAADAKTFITDPAQKPTVILTNHVLHWIDPEQMPEVLQNIFNQMDDNGAYLAAFYADTKQGLPFQTALDTLKSSEAFKSYFADFKPTQFFHNRQAMVEHLQATGFEDIHLDSNPVDKTFVGRAALQGFVQQWLPEYHHLKQTAPDSGIAESFLTQLIENYLVDTNQLETQPVSWRERSFTLFAAKPGQQQA